MACTYIFGKKGAGKSCLLVYLMSSFAYDFQRLRCCHREINLLNNNGFNLSYPDQLCFLDFKATFHKKGFIPKRCYEINGYEFALPNKDFKTVFIPPYSVVGLDEAEKYYNSRQKDLNEAVYREYELPRHYDLDIFLVAHLFNSIDKRIRGICDRFIKVDDLILKYDAIGRVSKMKWVCQEWTDFNVVTAYAEGGDLKSHGDKVIFETDINIFGGYNSQNFRACFYRDIDKTRDFDLVRTPDINLDMISIKEFNEKFDYIVPKGFRGK